MSTPSKDELKERALAAVVASAIGDALGANYAANPKLLAATNDGTPVTFATDGPWQEGEWTSSTAMAVPILKVLPDGGDLGTEWGLNGVVSEWTSWSQIRKGIDARLADVFMRATNPRPELAKKPLSELFIVGAFMQEHEGGPNTSNRAVTRIAPAALGYLTPGSEAPLAKAVDLLVRLTQHNDDVREAAVLLALGVRNAIRTGEPDLEAQVAHLPAERREIWKLRITEAEKSTPEAFKETNNTAVGALQAAIAANAGTEKDVKTVLERAVRAGGECDRVACIAGALAGARGGSVPLEWKEKIWSSACGSDGAAALKCYVDEIFKNSP